MTILLRTGIKILFLVSLIQQANAQGTCPGFGVGGLAASLESHETRLNAVTVLTNGKIIAVGYYDDAGSKDMLVAKYNANGTPDLTFSPNGIKVYDFGDHTNDEALCVAIASDGNLLVGGISSGYGAMMKLDAAGKLVSAFGSGGKVKYEGLYSTVEDIVVASNGDIFSVGKGFDTENIVFRRIRVHAYNSSGQFKTSFSEDGKYDRTDLLLWHTTKVKAALQSDGKLVIGGTTPAASNDFDSWFLLRLNGNGTPDESFHSDGVAEDPENVTSYLTDLTIGEDGSIYVTGFNNRGSDFPTLAITKKFKTNGDPDNSFNMSGSAAHIGAGNGAVAYALTVDSNGKVYIAGSKGSEAEDHQLMIAAYEPDGEHDAGFTSLDKIDGTTHGELLDLVRLSDGSFLACGYVVGKDVSYGILRKYSAAGDLQTSFNAGGANLMRYTTDGETRAVAVQSDGKIVAAGVYLADGSNTGIVVARFNTNGSPDLSFGTYGYARYDLTARREFLNSLYIYPDGKILAGGSINDAVSFDDFLIIRFNADGSMDESFGSGGYVKKHVGAYGKRNDVNGINVDSQGRILIAGDANFNGGSYQNATVMRLLPDGSTDTDFGTNGVFSINLTVVNDYFRDIVAATDGSIYVVGHGTVNMGGAVVKLNDDGELDTGFGTDGVFYTDWKEGYISRAHRVTLQPDGKILVASSHKPEDGTAINNAFIHRLSTSGVPDNSFGENGVREFQFSSQRDAYGLEMDNSGVIYFSCAGDAAFYLAQMDQTGNPLDDDYYLSNVTSRARPAINKSNGNVYSGYTKSNVSGLWIACMGTSGGGPVEECEGIDEPTITIQGDVLTSSEGDSYQWYSSGEPMEGETGQTLVVNPVAGGTFSVEVTIGDCSGFSDEFDYVVTGTGSFESTRLKVYPNPAKAQITIELNLDMPATASLYSTAGLPVSKETQLSDKASVISLEHLPNGLYILSIRSARESKEIKILKQN